MKPITVRMLTVIATAYAVPCLAHPRHLQTWVVDYHKKKVVVAYQKGGETAVKVQQRLAKEHNVLARTIFVFGGGYFEPKTRSGVDLTIVGGVKKISYRGDLKRPVIAVTESNVSIVYPEKGEKIPRGTKWALAAASAAQDPERATWRQMVGLKRYQQGEKLILVRFFGTSRDGSLCLATLGLFRHVWLDGGNAVKRGTFDPPVPSHIAVIPARSTTLIAKK